MGKLKFGVMLKFDEKSGELRKGLIVIFEIFKLDIFHVSFPVFENIN